MKERLTVDAKGQLVDRRGRIWGRLTSLTIELREGGAYGGDGLTSNVKGNINDSPQDQPLLLDGGMGETEIDIPVRRRLGEDGEPVPLVTPPVVTSAFPRQVDEIWAHYVEVMNPRRKELDPATRSLIRDALKVGSREEWMRGVDGCAASDVHMGRRGIGDSTPKKYNRPSQIFKGKRGIRTTREQLDLFLDFAERAGLRGSSSSVDPVRLTEAKRNVLTAWEFPKSEQAKKAGEMSAAWLAQHGYRVGAHPETGRPTFHAEGE